jgi:NAD(P)H-dependent flavin oxidoreductase YrpB (nitropropane dioxygenase family)
MDLRDRLGIETCVAQAALGGGVAGAELASAVSRAGGLGNVGIIDGSLTFHGGRGARSRRFMRPR